MTFRVGMKCVCVNDDRDLQGRLFPFKKGSIYTVIGIGNCAPGCTGLHFNGVKNPREMYCAVRFRPAVERKTDISCFTELLNPSPKKVLEEIMLDTLADIYLAADEAFEKTKSRIEPEVHIGFDPPSNH